MDRSVAKKKSPRGTTSIDRTHDKVSKRREAPSQLEASALTSFSAPHTPGSRVARPYRSHKFPACARCHKRRSRCTIETPGQACLLCRMSKVSCSAETKKDERTVPRVGFIHRSVTVSTDTDNYSKILGPVVARDTQVLESLVPELGTDGFSNVTGRPLQANTHPTYRSIIPSGRPSPPEHRSPRDMSTQLLRQIEPCIDSLLALYFEEVHPCLPLFDEQTLLARVAHRTLPHPLLVSFVAYATHYWDLSPILTQFERPDQDFAWQTACSAIDGWSQKGDMFSIAATVLNVAGRPSKGDIHNTGNVARATALAHGLGLNHDCDDWSLSSAEKHFRIKIWWAVVIHDRWFNFAQGTPPFINRAHYSVPIPSVRMLIVGKENSLRHVRAAECYVHLCRLTEIVGDVLPSVYHVRSGNDHSAAKQISQAETELEKWLADCPLWMKIEDLNERQPVPGYCNLQLSYLAVRMLLRRLLWHEYSLAGGDADSTCFFECLRAAEDVSIFVASLTARELAEFWVPHNAHHFMSAVTLLLRCAFQSSNSDTRLRSISAARQLVSCLKLHRKTSDWDIAEMVLPQAEAILRRVETGITNLSGHRVTSIPRAQEIVPPSSREAQRQDPQSNTDNFSFDTPELGAVEDMFPELFSEFIDSAFLDRTFEYTV